jgi:hypothetical protein
VYKDLSPHAGLPKTADVIRDTFDTLRLIGFRLEEVSDTVRHLHEMVNIHNYRFSMTR